MLGAGLTCRESYKWPLAQPDSHRDALTTRPNTENPLSAPRGIDSIGWALLSPLGPSLLRSLDDRPDRPPGVSRTPVVFPGCGPCRPIS